METVGATLDGLHPGYLTCGEQQARIVDANLTVVKDEVLLVEAGKLVGFGMSVAVGSGATLSFLSCLMSGSPGQPCGLPDKPRSDLSPRDTPAQLSSRPSGQGSGAVARSGMAGSRRGRHGQRLGLVEGVATVGKIQSWGGQNRAPWKAGLGGRL